MRRSFLLVFVFLVLVLAGIAYQVSCQEVTIEKVVVWVVLRSDGTMEVEYNLTFLEHSSRDRIRKLGPFEEGHNIKSALIVHNSEVRAVELSEVEDGLYSVLLGYTTAPGERYTVSIRYSVDKPVVIEQEMFGELYSIFAWAPFQWSLPVENETVMIVMPCLLYTSPSPRDRTRSRMPSSA